MSDDFGQQEPNPDANGIEHLPAPGGQDWRTLRIMAAASLASPIIFAGVSVALFTTGSLPSIRIGSPSGLGDTQEYLGELFWALAAVFVVVSLFVGVRPGGAMRQRPSRSSLFARYRILMLVRMALAEVPAVLGVVALILRADLGQALYLQGTAFAAMLFAWPRRESFESLCRAVGLAEPDADSNRG